MLPGVFLSIGFGSVPQTREYYAHFDDHLTAYLARCSRLREWDRRLHAQTRCAHRAVLSVERRHATGRRWRRRPLYAVNSDRRGTAGRLVLAKPLASTTSSRSTWVGRRSTLPHPGWPHEHPQNSDFPALPPRRPDDPGRNAGRRRRIDRMDRSNRPATRGPQSRAQCQARLLRPRRTGTHRTDANVVLATCTRNICARRLKLDSARAASTPFRPGGGPFKMTVDEAAYGHLRIVNNNMVGACGASPSSAATIRAISPWWGAGGAGPLHITALAAEMGNPAGARSRNSPRDFAHSVRSSPTSVQLHGWPARCRLDEGADFAAFATSTRA